MEYINEKYKYSEETAWIIACALDEPKIAQSIMKSSKSKFETCWLNSPIISRQGKHSAPALFLK